MKKLLGTKKFRVIASLLLVVTLLAAGSYAWFTGSATSESAATMGRLKMTSSLTGGIPGYYYEPGEEIDFQYVLDNIHAGQGDYKTVFAQANVTDGTVIISSDANGDPITSVERAIDPVAVLSTCGVKTVIDTSTFALSAWYVDRVTGLYYVLIDPGMDATVDVNIQFVGSEMGNEYQAAQFNFSGTFPYTQAMPDAVVDMFGLDWSNLDPVDEDGNILGLSGIAGHSTRGVNARDYYMGLLYAALGL